MAASTFSPFAFFSTASVTYARASRFRSGNGATVSLVRLPKACFSLSYTESLVMPVKAQYLAHVGYASASCDVR